MNRDELLRVATEVFNKGWRTIPESIEMATDLIRAVDEACPPTFHNCVAYNVAPSAEDALHCPEVRALVEAAERTSERGSVCRDGALRLARALAPFKESSDA